MPALETLADYFDRTKGDKQRSLRRLGHRSANKRRSPLLVVDSAEPSRSPLDRDFALERANAVIADLGPSSQLRAGH